MAQLWGQDVCHKVGIEEHALQSDAQLVERPHLAGEEQEKEVI